MIAACYLDFAQNIDYSRGAVKVWARWAAKDGREIEFPEKINIDRFFDQEQGSEEYRLVSGASHTGLDPRMGHDMAFGVIDGQWGMFDDECVQAVPYYAVFDENFPTRTFPPQRLQIPSLLLHEIISPQTLQSPRDGYNNTYENQYVSSA
jgi:hypothetical protein